MKHASQRSNPNWKSHFRKDWLPSALEYFQRYQIKLTGVENGAQHCVLFMKIKNRA